MTTPRVEARREVGRSLGDRADRHAPSTPKGVGARWSMPDRLLVRRHPARVAPFGTVLERGAFAAPAPREEEIRRRAEEIRRRRGGDGNAVLDWLEAERSLWAERRSLRRPRHATFPRCPPPIPASS